MGQDLLGYYATVATPSVFVQVMVNSATEQKTIHYNFMAHNRMPETMIRFAKTELRTNWDLLFSLYF